MGLKILLGIIEALEHLHNNNIVHKNLAPHNIWVDNKWQVKISGKELVFF